MDTDSTPSYLKPTRRQNARMQLAAALIEADNVLLLTKAQEAASDPLQDEEGHRFGPRPPPLPRLASESVLFKPWRDGYEAAHSRVVQTPQSHALAATGILIARRRNSLPPDQCAKEIDFLGVRLPGELNTSCPKNRRASCEPSMPSSDDKDFSSQVINTTRMQSQVGTSAGAKSPDLELLARIKLYRETRDNRPPVQPAESAQDQSGEVSTGPSRTSPSPLQHSASFDTLVALQGDFYTALALADSPYIGSPRLIQASTSLKPYDSLLKPSSRLHYTECTRGTNSCQVIAASFNTVDSANSNLSLPGSEQPHYSIRSASLSTRELQALARQSHFPESYGMVGSFVSGEDGEVSEKKATMDDNERNISSVSDVEHEDQGDLLIIPSGISAEAVASDSSTGLLAKALRPVTTLFGRSSTAVINSEQLRIDLSGDKEPDMSSTNWSPKKGQRQQEVTQAATIVPDIPSMSSSLSEEANAVATDFTPLLPAFGEEELYRATVDAEADIDDDFISPPRRGSLKPRGIKAWLPELLVTPQRLEHSPQMPRTELTKVPSPAAKFVRPVPAPCGIGRRGSMASTALFRNGLVHNEEEKEGWGWEPSSAPPPVAFESDEESQNTPSLSKEDKMKDKLTMRHAEVQRKKRHVQALRLKKRAQSITWGKRPDQADRGEASLTHRDLSEYQSTDSQATVSDDEEASLVETSDRPAGKLYGKSLLDLVQERQSERKAAIRFYGQLEDDDKTPHQEGHAPSLAPNCAATLLYGRPFVHNDTGERMRAAFGSDANWAREMEKKHLQDVKEDEEMTALQAAACDDKVRSAYKDKHKKDRILARERKGRSTVMRSASLELVVVKSVDEERTAQLATGSVPAVAQVASIDAAVELRSEQPTILKEPPQIDIGFTSPPKLGKGALQSWHCPSGEDSSDEDEQHNDEDEKYVQRRRHKGIPPVHHPDSTKAIRKTTFATSQPHASATSDDSSDDELPLSVLGRRLVSSAFSAVCPALSAAPSLSPSSSSSSDEEVPLAQLRKRRSMSKSGVLHRRLILDPSVDGFEVGGACAAMRSDAAGSSVALNTCPKLPQQQEQRIADDRLFIGDDTSDDDDAPLAATHARAAVIAQQAVVIKQLQLQTMSQCQNDILAPSVSTGMMPVPELHSSMMFVGTHPARAVSLLSPSPLRTSDLHLVAQISPTVMGIAQWRNNVVPRTAGSAASGSGSGALSSLTMMTASSM